MGIQSTVERKSCFENDRKNTISGITEVIYNTVVLLVSLISWFAKGKKFPTKKSKYLAHIYQFKVSNRNTSKRCKICSKLTVKTPEQHHLRRSEAATGGVL